MAMELTMHGGRPAGGGPSAPGAPRPRTADDRIAAIEALLDRLDALPDPAARELATATVQALLALEREGLRRVVERVGPAQARALADDELVGHLLLLHGLHPVPVEQRVRDALAGVRPYLESHGGDVELLGVADGVVRLRLEGSCEGCPASAMTLKLAIEEAVLSAAPDVERVEAEGVDDPAHAELLQIECSPALAAAPAAVADAVRAATSARSAAGAVPPPAETARPSASAGG
jgi:Fe-S cluster biogenesis protein NfuA